MDHLLEVPFFTSVVAGGTAGLAITILLPLDTCKTRLQSPNGFWQSGGFHGLYKGIVPVVIGSGPAAAIFFGIYNSTEQTFRPHIEESYYPFLHLGAATLSETMACLIKVPSEILKQRQQVGMYSTKLLKTCSTIFSREGIPGFYRGFASTILRDVPFVAIEIPVWEFLKKQIRILSGSAEVKPAETALCGAVASGTAAALTTPLDLAKTRIMLAERNKGLKDKYHELKVHRVLANIYAEKGVRGLFSGLLPRVLWIFTGGIVFFGSYELTKNLCCNCV